MTWLSLVPAFAYSPSMAFFEILVPTIDTVRSAFLLSANVESQKPTLLCGGSGVGKSVLTQRVLSELSKGGEWLGVQLNFSAQTSAGATQSMIEERLDKRRRTCSGRRWASGWRSSSTTSTCLPLRRTAPRRPSSCCVCSRPRRRLRPQQALLEGVADVTVVYVRPTRRRA